MHPEPQETIELTPRSTKRLFNVSIQSDHKPKSPWTTTVSAGNWATAVARAAREFQAGPAKGKRNKSWGVRVELVEL